MSATESSISTEEEAEMYRDLLQKRANDSLKKHPEGLLGHDKTYRKDFANKIKDNPSLLKRFGASSWRDILGPPLDEDERQELGYDEQDAEEDENGWETTEEDEVEEVDPKDKRIKELEIIAVNLRKDYENVRKENSELKCGNLKLKNKLYEKDNEKCGKKKYLYKCPCCAYKGLNIKRHVKMHHPESLHKLQEEREKRHERTKQHLKKRWCKMCDTYYARIHQHLQVKHKLQTNSQTYRHVLREAHKEFIKRKRGSSSSEDEKKETPMKPRRKNKVKTTSVNGGRKKRNHEKKKENQLSHKEEVKRRKGNASDADDEDHEEGTKKCNQRKRKLKKASSKKEVKRKKGVDDNGHGNSEQFENENENQSTTIRQTERQGADNDEHDEEDDHDGDDGNYDEDEDGTNGDDEDNNYGADEEDETNKENVKEDEEDSQQGEEQSREQDIDWNECHKDNDSSHIKVLKKFCKHLQHPDGGRKGERDAFQCTQRIHRMCIDLCEDDDLNVNWIRKHADIWENFVEKELRKKQRNPKEGLSAKTLKVYLLTLEKFCRFLIASRLVRPGKREDVDLLIKKLPLWRHSLRKDTRQQEEKKFEKDVHEMPEKENLKELLTHKSSLRVKDFLYGCDKEDNQDVPTKDQTIEARDYLIARVFIETMCRSGIVANLTIEDVLKAKEANVNGQKQFSLAIHSHKTIEHKGTSYPSLSSELHSLVLLFITKCRPLLVTDDDKPNDQRPVFVSSSGEPFESSSAGRRATSFAKKIGIQKNFTPTLLRKTSSTVVASDSVKEQELHAQLLEHTLSTEIKFYRRLNKEKLQSQASVQNQERLGIGNILGHPSKYREPENHEKKKEQDKGIPVEGNETLKEKPRDGNDEAIQGTATADSAELQVDDSCKSSGRPESFSENALIELREEYAEFLKLGIPPSLKEVEKISKKARYLGKHTAKAIRNRVAYEIKLNKPELPTSKMTLENRIKHWFDGTSAAERESIASSSYARSKWSLEDSQTIVKCFDEEMGKPHLPRKSTMMAIFHSTTLPELREIFLREDSEKWRTRCLDKVRTEWKKLHGKMPN